MGTCRGKQIVGPRLRSGDAACSLRFRKASACCSDARPRLGTAEQRAWRHDAFVGAGQRGEAALATSLAVKGPRARDAWWLVGWWGRASILRWFPGTQVPGEGPQAGGLAGRAPEKGQRDRAEGAAGL